MGKYSKNYIGNTFNNGNSLVVDGGDRMGFVYVKCTECAKDPELNGNAIHHTEIGQLKRGQVPCSCSPSPRYDKRQILLLINRHIIENNLSVEFVECQFNDKSLPLSKVTLKCLVSKIEYSVCSVRNFLKGTGNFTTSTHKGGGLVTLGKFSPTLDGKRTKEYDLWTAMLSRVYSGRYKAYTSCSVSDNFKNFQYFAEWCQHQIGFNIEGYSLDKDILVKGNKIYSEDTCVFVPDELNGSMLLQKKSRGEYPIGVQYRANYTNRPYRAIHTKTNYSSSHATAECAFQAYKQVKEDYMKSLAVKYKGTVDDRVIVALENYTVNIED